MPQNIFCAVGVKIVQAMECFLQYNYVAMAYSTKLSELVSGCKTGGKYVDPHYGLGGEHKLPVLTRLRQNYLCAGISFFLTESFRYVHGFVFVCCPVELCLETQHK